MTTTTHRAGVFGTYARSLAPPIQVVGRCHTCGNDIIDVFAGPTHCDCWDVPPADFNVDAPPTNQETIDHG
jgi:hypothetical protein